jgi:hypothetical protein
VDWLWRPRRRLGRAFLLLAVASTVVLGCRQGATASSGPAPTPTATPTSEATPASGIEGLIADLTGSGAAATMGSSFMAEPIGGEGRAVCIGPETVQVYEFIDHDAALAASARIDRQDPSNVGTGIVEWNGRPRFWLRDRIIVLYLGRDEPTDATLRDLLGPPFAESNDPGPGFLPTPPCR